MQVHRAGLTAYWPRSASAFADQMRRCALTWLSRACTTWGTPREGRSSIWARRRLGVGYADRYRNGGANLRAFEQHQRGAERARHADVLGGVTQPGIDNREVPSMKTRQAAQLYPDACRDPCRGCQRAGSPAVPQHAFVAEVRTWRAPANRPCAALRAMLCTLSIRGMVVRNVRFRTAHWPG